MFSTQMLLLAKNDEDVDRKDVQLHQNSDSIIKSSLKVMYHSNILGASYVAALK